MGIISTSDGVPDAVAAREPIRGGRAVILIVTLILGVLTYQMNSSMLNPALPDMAKSLGTTIADVSNVSSLFFLAGAVGGILFTRWSDFLGRRRGLLIVLGVLMLGTLLCVFAPSLPILLIGRVLQGASNATYNFAYLILAERLSPKKFGLAIGVIAAANGGLGGFDGLFGGWLADNFGYRSIFVVIFLVGVIATVLAMAVVPKDGALVAGRMDWWGLAILSVGLVCLTQAISTASMQGPTSVPFLAYLLGAIVAFVVFWYVEKAQKANALVEPRHLRSRRVWPLLATTILALAGVYSFTGFTVVLLAEDHHVGFGLDAATAGLLFLVPASVIGAICSPLVGWIANRTDWVWTLRIGMFACIAVLVILSLVTFDMWVVFALTAVTGITLTAMVMTIVNGLSVLLSPKEAPGVLAGLNGACFGIGAGLGIALVAPFVSMGTQAGYTVSLLVCVGVSILAGVATLFLKRPDRAAEVTVV